MLFSKALKRHAAKLLAIAGGLAAAATPLVANADGLTIFSGVNNELDVSYHHSGRNARNARYLMRISARDVETPVSQISIYIPAYYGEMDERLRNLECVENCEDIGEEFQNRVLRFEDRDALEDILEVGYGRRYNQEAILGNVTIEENCFQDWQGNERSSFHCLRIPLQESIEPGTPIQVKMSRIQNPTFGGTYYFHALLVSCLDEGGCFSDPDHEPVNDSPTFGDFRRGSVSFVGTWIITVD